MDQERELFLKFMKSLLLRVRNIDQRLEGIEKHITQTGKNSAEHQTDIKYDKHSEIDYSKAISIELNGSHSDSDISVLSRIGIFQDLSIEELTSLKGILKRRTYSDAEMVFTENSKGNSLLLITGGVVRIFRNESERHQFISLAEKGTVLGEMAFVDDGYRSASGMAQGNVEALELLREDLDSLAIENPELVLKIFRRIMQIMSTRLRFSNEHYAFDFKVTVRQEMIRLKKMGRDLVEILMSFEEI